MREILIEGLGARPFCSWFAIVSMYKFHHLIERCAGKKNLIHSFASQDCNVAVCDCSSAAAENLNVVGAFLAQEIDNGSEKFDVSAVITGNANSANVLLNCRANDVSDRPMITKVNHFDAMPNEFQVDRVDGTIVSVTNRDSS